MPSTRPNALSVRGLSPGASDTAMPSTRDIRTFCRICEPSCGLVATVADGRVTALRADQDHPVTKGFACHKGIAALDVHDDPDRLNAPMRRAADGEWTTASWDDALADIARRLDAIIAEHGPDAVSVYIGNPTAFNALGTNASATLIGTLGTRRTFNSGTQDCANKFAASQAVFGTTTVHPIPDVEHTDLCLIIGENPRASQGSFWSISNVMGELRSARAPRCPDRVRQPSPGGAPRARRRRHRPAAPRHRRLLPLPRCCTRSIGSAASTTT